MPHDGERIIVVLPVDGPLPATADLLGGPGTVPPHESLPPAGPDRLVLPPGAGAAHWWALVLGALDRCRVPLLVLTLLCSGLPGYFALRAADAVVLAPLLPELAGGAALVLVPAIVLIGVGLSSLLSAVCLAGTAGLVTGSAADGRPPRTRALLSLVGHRIWVAWIWLAVIHGVEFGLPYATVGLVHLGEVSVTPGIATIVGWATEVVFWASTVFVAVLVPVLLFERGGGARRALHLLRGGPRVPLIGLVLTSAVLSVLSPVVESLVARVWPGPAAVTAGLLTGIACTAVWAVSAIVTYAALVAAEPAERGDHGLVTAGFLRDSLAAEEA